MHAQFKNEKPEEKSDGDKIVLTQVALYKVNDESNEEDGDDERDKRKTINPYYLFLGICSY